MYTTTTIGSGAVATRSSPRPQPREKLGGYKRGDRHEECYPPPPPQAGHPAHDHEPNDQSAKTDRCFEDKLHLLRCRHSPQPERVESGRRDYDGR